MKLACTRYPECIYADTADSTAKAGEIFCPVCGALLYVYTEDHPFPWENERIEIVSILIKG